MTVLPSVACTDDGTPEKSVLRHIVADAAYVRMDLTDTASKAAIREGHCVAIRGLFDPSELPGTGMLMDFTIERQVADDVSKPAADEAIWKVVDTKLAIQVLDDAQDYAAETWTGRTDSVVTMPLPYLEYGDWGRLAVHPAWPGKLRDPIRDVPTLLRYVDFDVKPGSEYRYRARLIVQSESEPDATLQTAWSAPTSVVKIRRKGGASAR